MWGGCFFRRRRAIFRALNILTSPGISSPSSTLTSNWGSKDQNSKCPKRSRPTIGPLPNHIAAGEVAGVDLESASRPRGGTLPYARSIGGKEPLPRPAERERRDAEAVEDALRRDHVAGEGEGGFGWGTKGCRDEALRMFVECLPQWF